MKQLYFGLSVILLIVMIGVFSAELSPPAPVPPCDTPLLYRIGDIDHRFDIERREVAAAMREVEKLWSTAMNKDLIKYSPNADVTVELTYDVRANRMTEFFQKITAMEERIAGYNREHNKLIKRYKAREDRHNKLIVRRNHAVKTYNTNIIRWSSRRAGTEEQRQAEELSGEIERLEKLAGQELASANALLQQINYSSDHINEKTEAYNELISKHDYEIRVGRVIHKGDFTGNTISVYQFDDYGDLTMVLAHETGHALGLMHVPGERSVMNEYIKHQDASNPHLSLQDLQAIQSLCRDKLL